MIVHFSTTEFFCKDPLKAPFDSDTDYWFSDVQFVSIRPGHFKFSGVTSYDGSVGTDPCLEVSQFQVVPQQTFYEFDLDQIYWIFVDGVKVWSVLD